MFLKNRVGLAVLISVVACGGGDPSGLDSKPITRGIRIVTGATATDSARARLTPRLIVEVHDSSGALVAPGTLVRFDVLDDPTGTEVAALDADFHGNNFFATGETDATGRTGVIVWLGRRTGSARITISVPTLGLTATANYVVTPGSLSAVDASPSDSALFIGRSLTLRGQAQDAYGNARPEALAWSIQGHGASVSTAGVVTATALGRYEIVASLAGFSDTVHVSAVPDGVLAAYVSKTQELVTIALDGSNRRVRTVAVDGGIGVHPKWLPGTDRIVYSHYNGAIQELRVVDAAGQSIPFLPNPPATMSHRADASPAPDGSWVYFAAWDSRCVPQEYCLFRSRPDGSGVDLLGNLANPLALTNRPSSSSDGRQVAYTTNRFGPPSMEVLDAESRSRLPWGVVGVFPQWSPVGNRIAYIDEAGALSLINSDGSGVQRLADGPWSYLVAEPFTWSPDGQYIARRRRAKPELLGQFELVVVATGEVLPLPFLDGYSDPSWK